MMLEVVVKWLLINFESLIKFWIVFGFFWLPEAFYQVPTVSYRKSHLPKSHLGVSVFLCFVP